MIIARGVKRDRKGKTKERDDRHFLQRQFDKEKTFYRVVLKLDEWMEKFIDWKAGRNAFRFVLKTLNEIDEGYLKIQFGHFNHDYQDCYVIEKSAKKYVMNEKLQKKLQFSVEEMTGKEIWKWMIENENSNLEEQRLPWDFKVENDDLPYYIIRRHW